MLYGMKVAMRWNALKATMSDSIVFASLQMRAQRQFPHISLFSCRELLLTRVSTAAQQFGHAALVGSANFNNR